MAMGGSRNSDIALIMRQSTAEVDENKTMYAIAITEKPKNSKSHDADE